MIDSSSRGISGSFPLRVRTANMSYEEFARLIRLGWLKIP